MTSAWVRGGVLRSPGGTVRTVLPRPPLQILVIRVALVLAVLGLTGARTGAAESWTVASGEVQVRCRLTVGGSFDAVTPDISGSLQQTAPDAASYTSELRVNRATLDTGIGWRNDHLRATYLATERGPDFGQAVLSGIELDAALPGGAGRRETTFSGTLSLHGVARAVEGEVELRRRDGRMQVEAAFSLGLEAFDIPPPRYLGIGVRDAIRVTVRFEAAGGETLSDGAR